MHRTRIQERSSWIEGVCRTGRNDERNIEVLHAAIQNKAVPRQSPVFFGISSTGSGCGTVRKGCKPCSSSVALPLARTFGVLFFWTEREVPLPSLDSFEHIYKKVHRRPTGVRSKVCSSKHSGSFGPGHNLAQLCRNQNQKQK